MLEADHALQASRPLTERGLDEWLDGAARVVGLTGLGVEAYGRGVKARISKGAEEYGESFRTRPLSELLKELEEEALDIGAWSALISTRLSLEDEAAQHRLLRLSGWAMHIAGEIEDLQGDLSV